MENEACVGQTAEPAQNINYEKLRSAVKAIGFGYAFLYLNLSLGRAVAVQTVCCQRFDSGG